MVRVGIFKKSGRKAEKETRDNIKVDLSEVGCKAVDNIKMGAKEFFVTLGCGRKWLWSVFTPRDSYKLC